jgi:hypothetical protein
MLVILSFQKLKSIFEKDIFFSVYDNYSLFFYRIQSPDLEFLKEILFQNSYLNFNKVVSDRWFGKDERVTLIKWFSVYTDLGTRRCKWNHDIHFHESSHY